MTLEQKHKHIRDNNIIFDDVILKYFYKSLVNRAKLSIYSNALKDLPLVLPISYADPKYFEVYNPTADTVDLTLYLDKQIDLASYIRKMPEIALYLDKQRPVTLYIDEIISKSQYIDKQASFDLIRER